MKQTIGKSERLLRQLTALKNNSINMRLAAEKWDKKWKTLIAIMMSAQSRDETTIIIAKKLFETYPSLESLARADYKAVLSVFKSLNYNKTKTKHIIECARILVEEYAGKVPEDFEKLIQLPGVGRKTANVFLSEYGHDAIGVDTHVFYISRKLGWAKSKTPKGVETELKEVFPKKDWININATLVRFGKTYPSKKKKDSILNEIKKIN